MLLRKQKGKRKQQGKGAAGLTLQNQLLKRPIDCPGAIGVLAGLQGRGDGLGSLISNAAHCSSARAVLSVIMLLRKQKGKRKQ